MEFTNTTSTSINLCIVCCKTIPQEYYNQRNATNVRKFNATLTKFLVRQSASIKDKLSISTGSFGSCEDCELLTLQFSDLYHEIQCLELQMFGKLESLGNILRTGEDKIPFQPDFRNIRAELQKKCNDARKFSKKQPRVLLKRLDQTAEVIATRQVLPKLEDDESDGLILNNKLKQIKSEKISSEKYPEDGQNLDTTHSTTYGSLIVPEKVRILERIEVKTDSNLFLDENEEEYEGDPLNFTSNLPTLDIHRRNSNGNSLSEQSLTCQQCGKSFKHKSNLAQHMEFHKNPQEWKHECPICGKKCALKHILQQHIACHSEDRPFSCETCGRGFKTSEFLRLHLISHQNPEEWKYECEFCGKKFANKQSWTRHLLVHSEKRPFTCKQCGKGFKSGDLLKRHLACHTKPEEWKHECLSCGRKFAERGSLRRHMNIHAGIKRVEKRRKK